jgi:UDP-glucose 4-epimerase
VSARATERRRAVRPARPRVLLIHGASGVGRALARRLHRSFEVMSFDAVPFADKPKDVDHHVVDIRRKAAIQLAKKRPPHVVLAVGAIHVEQRGPKRARSQTVVESAAQLLHLVQETQAQKLIYLSAGALYGPSPMSPGFLLEDAALLGARAVRRYADAISVDMMMQSFFWKQPSTETVVLRPTHMVGDGIASVAMRYLQSVPTPTLMGFDPMLQLVHIDDVVHACMQACKPGLRGVFNIVGDGQAPLSRILQALKRRTVPIPHALLHAGMSRLARFGFSALSAEELVHLKYSCLLDGTLAATTLGYKPARSMEDTLRDILAFLPRA